MHLFARALLLASVVGIQACISQPPALEAGRPDPNVIQYFTFSRPLRQYMNAADKEWLTGLKGRALAEGATEADIQTVSEGMRYSSRQLIATQIRVDLAASATSFSIPYCEVAKIAARPRIRPRLTSIQ
jgi:hypothetical protein